jgi:lipoprotein LprG
MAHRLISVLTIATLLAVTAACMGNDGESDTTDPEATPVTAESVLSSASDRWSETESAHFNLTVEGQAFLDDAGTISLRSAEGDIKRPDSVTATARLGAIVGNINVQIIAIGGEVYMTNFISGRWEVAPDDFSYDPSVLFSDTDGIGPVMTQLQSPQLRDGTETVNGREAHVITGTVDAQTVSRITAGTIEGEAIDVVLWIAQDNYDLVQVTLTEPEGVRDEPATWTLLLTEHNKDVTIEAPTVSMMPTT